MLRPSNGGDRFMPLLLWAVLSVRAFQCRPRHSGRLRPWPSYSKPIYGDGDCVDIIIRSIAAESLLPVFYEDVNVGTTLEAEKALKRCLRSYQRAIRKMTANKSGSCADRVASTDAVDLYDRLPSSSRSEREATRKRLSDLILGTSIMRLLHWHELFHGPRASDFSTVDLIVGIEPWMVRPSAEKVKPAESRFDVDNTRISLISSLVDLHSKRLDTTEKSATLQDIPWPSDPIQRISISQSMPSFIIKLWVDQYGVQVTKILAERANKPGPVTLRRSALRCDSDEELIQRLRAEANVDAYTISILGEGSGIALKAPRGSIMLDYDGKSVSASRPRQSLWSLPSWQEGCFEVQDIGSQIIVDSVEVERGDNVIVDFCAGNGGKTLAIASRMWEYTPSAGGKIIAHDIVESRLKQLLGSLERAGLTAERFDDMLFRKDGERLQVHVTSDATTLKSHRADIVLVDAPCSSLGVLRRRPGHRWTITEEKVLHELPELQHKILISASRLVKAGGKLVYATCSICHAENEGVADKFEKSDVEQNWERWPFPNSESHHLSIMPHVHGCDGFFISRWKRRSKGQ